MDCCEETDTEAAESGCQAPGADPLLCYCFGVRVSDLEVDPALGGPDRVVSWIRGRVAAGECSCAEMNPSGRCCLGDVQRAAARIRTA